jgi:hypothetical protein
VNPEIGIAGNKEQQSGHGVFVSKVRPFRPQGHTNEDKDTIEREDNIVTSWFPLSEFLKAGCTPACRVSVRGESHQNLAPRTAGLSLIEQDDSEG